MASTEFDLFISNVLGTRYWRFSQGEHNILAESLRFLDDGCLFGYGHPNEKYWSYDNKVLQIRSEDQTVTSEFDEISVTGDKIKFTGRYVFDGAPAHKLYLELQDLEYIPKAYSPTKDHYITKDIGNHTYGIISIYDSNSQDDLEIGRFTSIGPGVSLIVGSHNYNFVSTYPFASMAKMGNIYWDQSRLRDIDDHIYSGKTRIGSDVWIGHTVIIKGGVTIGDGAVIAAGSIVTKDVPPYAIFGGVPAKLIKFRFSPEQITKLASIRWFDWEDYKINENIRLIMSDDIDSFINAHCKEDIA